MTAKTKEETSRITRGETKKDGQGDKAKGNSAPLIYSFSPYAALLYE